MSTFDEREKGFEQKFSHDKELEFKVKARSNRLLGLWVAKELGIPAAEAEAYAKSIVEADLAHHDVVQKILADCKQKGVAMTEHRLHKHMQELREVAREQVKKEAK